MPPAPVQHPLLQGPLPLARIGEAALSWPDHPPIALSLSTALVLPYLDGTVAVDDLVDDAAAALEADRSEVEREILPQLALLTSVGAVVVPDEDADQDADDPAPPVDDLPDDIGGRIIEVIERDGERTVVRELPDGRRRRTVTVTVDAANPNAGLRDALTVNALTDNLTADSCVGFKLRAGEPAVDLLIAVGEWRTRVRVDHTPTLEELRRRLGPDLIDERELISARDQSALDLDAPDAGAQGDTDDERSLVEQRAELGVTAYVIAPLDGVGRPRVYNRWGQRVGRPVTVAEAADVVGHLLNEEHPAPPSAGVIVSAFPLVAEDGSCVLVATPFRAAYRIHRAARSVGLEPVECRRLVVLGDGSAQIESPWPDRSQRTVQVRGLIAFDDEALIDPRAGAVAMLLADAVASGPNAAQAALNLLVVALGSVPAIAVRADDAQAVPSIARSIIDGDLRSLAPRR